MMAAFFIMFLGNRIDQNQFPPIARKEEVMPGFFPKNK